MMRLICDLFKLYHGAMELGTENDKFCNMETKKIVPESELNVPPVFISREPIDRFVSAYMMLCIKLDVCEETHQASVHKFVEFLYDEFNKDGEEPKLPGKYGDFMAHHLGLQTWYCVPETMRNIRIESDVFAELKDYFLEAGMPAMIVDKAISRLQTTKINGLPPVYSSLRDHVTSEIYSNCDTLRKLTEIYYQDFCWHITIFCTATTVAIVILSINLVVFFHKRLPLFENVYERKTVIEEQCTAKTGHCYAVIDHVWTRDHVVAGLHERWFNQPTDNRTRVLEADIIDYIADSRRRGTISISMHNVYKEKGRAAVFQLTKQLEAYFPSCFVFEARIAEEVLTVCTKTDIPPKPILISRLETAIRDVRLNHMRQMKIRKSNQSIYLAWKK
ncbi:unnamed protein product, partial [Mesorhabditis spiculigera]